MPRETSSEFHTRVDQSSDLYESQGIFVALLMTMDRVIKQNLLVLDSRLNTTSRLRTSP